MLYEGGIREPMIVKWPGVTKAGTVCHEPVIGVDFYPTLLEITGTQRRADYALDGLSFAPLLRDPAGKFDRPAIFWHFPCFLQGSGDPHGGPFRTTPAGAVRMGDWKLIEWFETGRLELYNLKQDLSETTNLAEQETGKLRELHQAMKAWREHVEAPIPSIPNAKYDPDAPPQKQRKGKKRSKARSVGG